MVEPVVVTGTPHQQCLRSENQRPITLLGQAVCHTVGNCNYLEYEIFYFSTNVIESSDSMLFYHYLYKKLLASKLTSVFIVSGLYFQWFFGEL